MIHIPTLSGSRFFRLLCLILCFALSQAASASSPSTENTGDHRTHTIRKGETLFRLTQIYHVSAQAICRANPGLSAENFPIGKEIIIPTPAELTSSAQAAPEKPLRVALLLPFGLDNPLPESSRMLEFYEGFLLALDTLKQRGYSVHLDVYDTGGEGTSLKPLLDKPELRQADLLIGGYHWGHIKQLSDFSRSHRIKMVLPSNSDISGYDSLIYEVYFGELSDAERSDFVAMENNMALFIEYAEQIMKIEQITMADEDLVQNAVTAYNAIKTDYKDFGYSDDEWNAMVTAAQQASDYIKQLRFSHASYEIKQLQEKINSLAGEYDPAKIPVMEDIQARLRLLTGSEREVLDLTYYNQYVAEYEKHQNDQPVDPDPDNPENPENPDNPENPGTGYSCGNCSSKVGFESVGLLATALVAAFFVMKRRTK